MCDPAVLAKRTAALSRLGSLARAVCLQIVGVAAAPEKEVKDWVFGLGGWHMAAAVQANHAGAGFVCLGAEQERAAGDEREQEERNQATPRRQWPAREEHIAMKGATSGGMKSGDNSNRASKKYELYWGSRVKCQGGRQAGEEAAHRWPARPEGQENTWPQRNSW